MACDGAVQLVGQQHWGPKGHLFSMSPSLNTRINLEMLTHKQRNKFKKQGFGIGDLEIIALFSHPVDCAGIWDCLAPHRYGAGTFSSPMAGARVHAWAAQLHVAAPLICYATV